MYTILLKMPIKNKVYHVILRKRKPRFQRYLRTIMGGVRKKKQHVSFCHEYKLNK